MANEVTVQKDAAIVEYEVNGEKVKLSIPTIKKYLVSGNGQITDQEAMMFLSLCRYQHLNPFVKDAYCIKYGNSEPATLVIGKDVFTKRAEKNPAFNGMENGIIVLSKNDEIVERKGSFLAPGEKVVGGWCKVYIKGREVPQYDSVSFDEYAGYKKDGSLNSNWAKRPATMIEKVAIMHALRNAFPNDFQGMYVEEEMANGDLKVNIKEEVQEEIQQNANKTEFKPVEDEEPAMNVSFEAIEGADGQQELPFK